MSDAATTSPGRVQGMLCPICRVDLVLADRQGVEIDYCPQCRGIWLDRGELDKIIEKNAAYEASGGPTSAPAASYEQSRQLSGYDEGHHRSRHGGRHHGGGHGSYRPGGFLGRLFHD